MLYSSLYLLPYRQPDCEVEIQYDMLRDHHCVQENTHSLWDINENATIIIE